MSPEEQDGWHTKMLELQLDLAKKAVDEVNRLRKRIRELEAAAAAVPATAYMLQERVTLLELELAKMRAAHESKEKNHG